MDPASLIRTARLDAGLTQAQLAERAATSQPAIARYESGAASPSVATLDRILRATGRRLVLAAEAATAQPASSARMRALRARRREILALMRAHRARNPRVFGSTARGEDRPGSDIDLVVDIDFRDQGLFPLLELRDALSELLGEPVDLVAASLLKPEVAAGVERDGIRL